MIIHSIGITRHEQWNKRHLVGYEIGIEVDQGLV